MAGWPVKALHAAYREARALRSLRWTRRTGPRINLKPDQTTRPASSRPGLPPHTPAATARVRTRSDRVAAAPGSGGSESSQSRRTARALRVASAPESDAEGRAAVTSEGAGSESGRWPSVGTYRRSFYAPEKLSVGTYRRKTGHSMQGDVRTRAPRSEPARGGRLRSCMVSDYIFAG